MSPRGSKRRRSNSPDTSQQPPAQPATQPATQATESAPAVLQQLIPQGIPLQTILEEPPDDQIRVLRERMRGLGDIFVSLNKSNIFQIPAIINVGRVRRRTIERLQTESVSRLTHAVGPIRVTPAELQTLSNFNLISLDLGDTFTSDQQTQNLNNVQEIRRLQEEINRLENDAINTSLVSARNTHRILRNYTSIPQIENGMSERPRRNMGGPGGPSTRGSPLARMLAQNAAEEDDRLSRVTLRQAYRANVGGNGGLREAMRLLDEQLNPTQRREELQHMYQHLFDSLKEVTSIIPVQSIRISLMMAGLILNDMIGFIIRWTARIGSIITARNILRIVNNYIDTFSDLLQRVDRGFYLTEILKEIFNFALNRTGDLTIRFPIFIINSIIIPLGTLLSSSLHFVCRNVLSITYNHGPSIIWAGGRITLWIGALSTTIITGISIYHNGWRIGTRGTITQCRDIIHSSLNTFCRILTSAIQLPSVLHNLAIDMRTPCEASIRNFIVNQHRRALYLYVRTVTTINLLYQRGSTSALEFTERQMVRLITLITQTCRGSFSLMSAVEQYGIMGQLAALWVPRTIIQGVREGVAAVQGEIRDRALMPPPPPPPPGIPQPTAAQSIPPPPGIPQPIAVQQLPDQELQTLRQRIEQLLNDLRNTGNHFAVDGFSRVINALSRHRDGALTGLREFFYFLHSRFRGNLDETIQYFITIYELDNTRGRSGTKGGGRKTRSGRRTRSGRKTKSGRKTRSGRGASIAVNLTARTTSPKYPTIKKYPSIKKSNTKNKNVPLDPIWDYYKQLNEKINMNNLFNIFSHSILTNIQLHHSREISEKGFPLNDFIKDTIKIYSHFKPLKLKLPGNIAPCNHGIDHTLLSEGIPSSDIRKQAYSKLIVYKYEQFSKIAAVLSFKNAIEKLQMKSIKRSKPKISGKGLFKNKYSRKEKKQADRFLKKTKKLIDKIKKKAKKGKK